MRNKRPFHDTQLARVRHSLPAMCASLQPLCRSVRRDRRKRLCQRLSCQRGILRANGQVATLKGHPLVALIATHGRNNSMTDCEQLAGELKVLEELLKQTSTEHKRQEIITRINHINAYHQNNASLNPA